MPKQPTLFTRLENDASIISPVIGPTGSISGTITYAAGKWGNGASGFTLGSPGINASWQDVVSTAKGTISFWWKPTWDETSSTTTDLFSIVGSSDIYEFFLLWHGSIKKFLFNTYDSGIYKSIYQFGYSWDPNQLMHIAITWDSSLGADQKMRMFINGIGLNGTCYESYDSSWNLPATIPFKWRSYPYGYADPSALFDNLKVYNYVLSQQQILKDMNSERGNLNDQIIIC